MSPNRPLRTRVFSKTPTDENGLRAPHLRSAIGERRDLFSVKRQILQRPYSVQGYVVRRLLRRVLGVLKKSQTTAVVDVVIVVVVHHRFMDGEWLPPFVPKTTKYCVYMYGYGIHMLLWAWKPRIYQDIVQPTQNSKQIKAVSSVEKKGHPRTHSW